MDPNQSPFLIKVSDDYYTAFLTLETVRSEDHANLEAAIANELRRLNIVYGIDSERIAEIISANKSIHDTVIATGDRHINGADAYITHMVSFEGTLKPIVKEDGSVDFKNLLQVSAVNAGDTLAVKTPAKPGSDGMTVTGKPIKHRPGKDIQWRYGENVIVSEDQLSLLAQKSGIAKLINGRITVSQVIEVDEVGPVTGNIYFGGDIHVKGNVLNGYTIHCDGDLTIDGVVEGCIIKTKGHLAVSKGILGHDTSDIVVGGNLTTKFIENASVYVKGEIETGEIVNSRVLCDSKITVKGKKGLIIGGDITSKNMIEANRIGSKLGVITNINLGVDASVIQELKTLKEVVQELKILSSRLSTRIPVLRANALMQPEVGVHEDVLKQYEESLLSTQIDLEDKQARLDYLMDALRHVKKGQVKINSIYPDTMIRIGNAKYFVDKALSACIISMEDDRVVAIETHKK